MFQQTSLKRVLFSRTRALAVIGVFAAVSILVADVFGGFLFGPQTVFAANATNNTLNFQARLETASGAIVPDGYYNVQFKLYDGDTAGGTAGKGAGYAGTNLWTETWYDSNGATAGNDNRVRVVNGYLSVSLGSQTAFPNTINWDQGLWLTMNIGGTTQTATPTWDGEMNPRLQLTSVPYALRAGALAAYNSGADLTSTLSLVQPTVGNQSFQIADQGAAGTYTICVQSAAAGTGGCAPTTGGSGYIQNQNTGAQTTSNFWISGTGRADTSLLTPAIDVAVAGTLSIGTTTATTVNIATNAATHTIAIGNGAAAQTITIGSTNGTSKLTLQAGTGNFSVTGATATTYTIGSTTGTGTITLGQSTANNTINIGNANVSANTQTINIGTGSSSTGKDMVTIGSTNGASTTTIQAGSGNINLSAATTAISGILNASGNITSTAGVLSVQGTGNNYFAGNVGIGTSSPIAALDVRGGSTATGFSITNPAGTYTNQWTRLGQCSISTQYHRCEAQIHLQSTNSGNAGVFGIADIDWRVKQQAAIGSAPIVELYMSNSNYITKNDVVAVVTQNDAVATVVTLYLRPTANSMLYEFNPAMAFSTNGNDLSWFDSDGYTAALPAGTQTVASYKSANFVDGTFEGNLSVGGQTVITSGQVLQNVTASAGILTSGTIGTGLLSGSYTGITGVGTITTGTWNAGVIPTGYGGTGLSGSAAANGQLLIGNGSGYTLATLTAGSGISIANAAGGITINATGAAGTAGGDLSGTYPNPTIASLQGSTLTITTPASGNFLQFNGTAWVNKSVSGDITISSTGVASIGTSKVTSAMIVDGTVTGTDITNNTITNSDMASGTFGNITGTGALAAGSIASGFGTIATSNTITGTTINGTTGINTGAGAGTQRIDASGNLTNIGNATLSGGINAKGYVSGNTSNLYSGQYTELATCTLTAQYQDCRTQATIVTAADGGSSDRAFIDIRVKQQAAMAGAPYISLTLNDNAGISPSDIVAVTTQNDASATVVQLYGKINATYRTWEMEPLINTGSVQWTWLANQAFTATLPAGTQTAATYIDANFVNGNFSGNLSVGGQTVITSGQVLQNVTASAGILTSGTISTSLLSGSYTGITGVGTLTTGTWNASVIGAAYGGTGVNGAAAANGQLLIGNGSGYTLATLTAGSGISISNAAGGITINATSAAGTAGGDLSGTYPNPTVAKIQGTALNISGPTSGQILVWNGTGWTNTAVSGDITITSAGVASIGTGKVTTTSILDGTIADADLSTGTFTHITGTGALAAGSIASGFGTISTSNTITGTTINGTTGINTGAGAGTSRLTSAGVLQNITGYTQNSGNATFKQNAANTFTIQALQAPTTDMALITNNGYPITTAGINAQQIDYYAALGTAGNEAASERVNITNTSATAGTITDGIRLVVTSNAASGDTNAIKIDGITGGTGTETAINLGTGFDNLLSYNGTQLINGSGILQSAAISGSYTGITGVGTLTTGTWNGSTIGVGYGGTGATSFTSNGILYGNGNGSLGVTGAGTTGQCLVATTGGAPTWGSCGSGTTTLQAAYSASTSPEITLDTTRNGLTIRNASADAITGNLLEVQNNAGTATFLGITPTAFNLQDSSGNAALGFDSTNSILKIFENVTSPTNYASISYASGKAIFSASSGTTQIGSGTGSVTSNLTGSTDVFNFAKTYTPGAAYSLNDFTLQRALTAGTFSATGSVVKIEDASTGSAVAPNVLLINQNNTSAGGNLILAQTGGSTTKFSVSTAGLVNAVGGYAYNGTSGWTNTCTSNNVIINAVVQGGIITNGSCAAGGGGGGGSGTLQNDYDNSTAPASILLANAKDFVITSPDTTTDSNVLINLQCTTCSASGGRFAVQDAGVDVLLVNPDGSIRIGDATNNMTFSASTKEPTLNGTARHTRKITLIPEYTGASMTGDGTNNNGTMTSDNETTSPFRNYYKWTTTQGSAQDYDIWVKVPVPSDFSGLPSGQTICLDTYASATTANLVNMTVYGTNNSAVITSGDLSPLVTTSWQNKCTASITGGTFAADGVMTLDIKMTAPATSGEVRIGNITLSYLSKW